MTWLAKGGGVDRNVFLTIDRLKEDFDFHFAVGGEIHHNGFKNIPNLPVFICKNLVRPISPIKDFKALWYFYRLIKKEKYNIVHTHETKASFITRLAAWLAGCPCIIYGLHGVTFNDPLNKWKRLFYIWIEKLTISCANFIVAVSRDCIHQYHQHGIGKNIPYKIIYSGIDVEKFKREANCTEEKKAALKKKAGISEKDIVLINIGRFSFSKGQRYTIKAFAILKNKFPHLKLLFVGEGELIESCKKQAETLKVKKDIIFYGFNDKIGELLAISDINVLTSLREGLPRVVVEAGIIKVPTVAFEVEGLGEIIENEKNGYIVPPYDVTALAEKIASLIKHVSKRKAFGNKISTHVQQWDAKIMAEELKKTYLNCLQNEKRTHD